MLLDKSITRDVVNTISMYNIDKEIIKYISYAMNHNINVETAILHKI